MAEGEKNLRDDMVGFLADQKAEATLSYVNRGRPLSEFESGVLKARWIEILGEMGELNYANASERDDIESELTLRGEEPPAEAVDLDRAMTNMVADLARMRTEEPGKFARMQRIVGADALDLLMSRYGQPPH